MLRRDIPAISEADSWPSGYDEIEALVPSTPYGEDAAPKVVVESTGNADIYIQEQESIMAKDKRGKVVRTASTTDIVTGVFVGLILLVVGALWDMGRDNEKAVTDLRVGIATTNTHLEHVRSDVSEIKDILRDRLPAPPAKP